MALRNALALVVFCAPLIGCFSSNPDSFWRSPTAIRDSLKALEGQSMDVAIKRLGLPQAQQNIAGRSILVWSDEGTISTLQATPLINPLNGNLNWYAVQSSRKHYCIVRAVISPDETISLLEIKASSMYYCPGQ